MKKLIKKLGGYEKAKDGLHRLKLEKKDLLICGDLVVVKSEIDAALIEYRREHNIFEVGDKVVFIHPFELGDLFTVHSMCERFIGVKRKNDERIYYAEIVWGLKHATDAEIEAGRAL